MPHPNLDDPVTQHMRRDLVPLRAWQTVGESLAQIRTKPPEGRIVYFFVTDDDGRLAGVVPTRRMLLSPLDAKIDDIMIRNVITMPNSATVFDACELFIMHKLLALPVVDEEKRFLGVVDIELYTEEISDLTTKAAHDDAFQLLGFNFAEARRGTPWNAFLVRFPWLTCNIVGGILAALVSSAFQGILDRHVVLALFVPAVLSLSESVAIQSVSLALDSLHAPRSKFRIFAASRRELATSALLGIVSGFLLSAVALGWKRQLPVAGTLFIAMAISITTAGLIGLLLPYLMRWLRQDPRVAAGPIALVGADLATLVVYFNLANYLMG